MSDAGRRYERLEPTAWRLLRGGLMLPWSLLPATVAGAVAGRLGAGLGLADAWTTGTFLGVLVGLPVVAALWARASRRRYGGARVVAEGVVFDEGHGRTELVQGGQLLLEEVDEHGVLVTRRDASSVERWLGARLVPTSSPAESEELVALLSAWDRQGHQAPLRLADHTPLLLLAVCAVLLLLSVGGLLVVDPLLARGRLAAALALMVTPLLAIDLARWLPPLVGQVVLTGGELRVNEVVFEVPRTTLRAAGGWLFAESGPHARTVWLRPSGVEQLRARLGPAVGEHPDLGPFLAGRRRHLIRALALLLAGPLVAAVLLETGWLRG